MAGLLSGRRIHKCCIGAELHCCSPHVIVLLTLPWGCCLQKLGTALGYVLLLTRVLAHYLHAPLLHCLVYQGSTSSLTPLPSFWDPLSAAHESPLSTLAVLHVTAAASASWATTG